MARSVSLKTGCSFETVTAARAHFTSVLSNQDLKQPFSGADLADISALYEDYCAKTDWALPSPPASFYPTQERGRGYTTRCFGVTFEDGKTATFSLDKALRAIAA